MTGRAPAAFAALVLLAVPGFAAGPITLDTHPGAEMAPVPPPSADGTLALSLEDATALALSRNLDLAVTRIDTEISRFRIVGARGAYDPSLTAYLEESSNDSPSASRISGTSSKSRVFNTGYRQPFDFGGVVEVGWNSSRYETDSSFYSLNPSYSSGLTASFNQPLLRNFGREVGRYQIRLAQKGRRSSIHFLEASIQKTMIDVENAYWDVIFARRTAEVSRQSLGVAADLLRITRIRVDVGTLAPIDIVSNESGVASREEAIIRADAAVANAEDRLKRLVNLPADRWEEKISLTDSRFVEPLPPFEEELAAAQGMALTRRPELRQARLDVDVRKMTLAFDRNQALPTLDAFARYGYSGIAGRSPIYSCDPVADPTCTNPTVIGYTRDGFDDALTQIGDRDYKNWSVGLSFGMRLGNRTARARVTESRLGLERSVASVASLEQQVLLDVRLAARAVRTALEAVEAAGKARTLGERNLDAERKKYENGMTTNFQILQVEEQLAQARQSELGSRLGYFRSLADFHRAKGDLLEWRGITLAVEEEEPSCPGICCALGCDPRDSRADTSVVLEKGE